MTHLRRAELTPPMPISPLVLSDRLLTLAEWADNAGYRGPARRLLRLALSVLDEPAQPLRPFVSDAYGAAISSAL